MSVGGSTTRSPEGLPVCERQDIARKIGNAEKRKILEFIDQTDTRDARRVGGIIVSKSRPSSVRDSPGRCRIQGVKKLKVGPEQAEPLGLEVAREAEVQQRANRSGLGAVGFHGNGNRSSIR